MGKKSTISATTSSLHDITVTVRSWSWSVLLAVGALGCASDDPSPGQPDSNSDGVTSRADAGTAPNQELTCRLSGWIIPAGESLSDECNTCSCDAGAKLTCAAKACTWPFATAPEPCALATTLAFRYYAGHADVEWTYEIDAQASLRCVHFQYGQMSWSPVVPVTSQPTIPECGASGAPSVPTIGRDLADPDVKAALSGLPDLQQAFPGASGQMFGIDDRTNGGEIWTVALPGRLGGLAVGSPCPSSPAATACRPIPAGIQRLVDDLKGLVTASEPACYGGN